MITDGMSKDKTWETLAKEVIVNFYLRSGIGRGNYDRLVDFDKELSNLVGFSLNAFENELPDPSNWSDSERMIAENGDKKIAFDTEQVNAWTFENILI